MDIRADYSGSRLGKYYLIQKLGNGGFGAVYRARDSILGVEKAIKILEVSNPTEAYKLFSEAAIPYKCQHNHIVKINGGEIVKLGDEVLFVVDMELANGQSIDNMLKKSYISINDCLNIIRNILFAVEYSHLQGIIHRDIKPANILLDNGIPKLADFGLATALGNIIIPWKWYVTHAAPETFVDTSIATVQTDIYAIGMTLYRMVNGIGDWETLLQRTPNAMKLITTGKLIDKLPYAPTVPEKVKRIIKRACNVDPNKRYQTATEMRNAIERLAPLHNWKPLEENCWVGESTVSTKKQIYIDAKRNYLEVVVSSNERRITKDCKRFDNIVVAKQYMYDYIRQSTLQ